MITHRCPLDEAPEAFRLFDSGGTAKVVIQP
jgi:threonine dehydrogenase-like Zn-dependent dehydrogenase